MVDRFITSGGGETASVTVVLKFLILFLKFLSLLIDHVAEGNFRVIGHFFTSLAEIDDIEEGILFSHFEEEAKGHEVPLFIGIVFLGLESLFTDNMEFPIEGFPVDSVFSSVMEMVLDGSECPDFVFLRVH